MKFLLPLNHFLLFVHYAYGIYVYVFVITPTPEVAQLRPSFAGPFKYLTFWDMLLQCLFFAIALTNDAFGSEEENPKRRSFLQKVRDFVFSTVAFPLGAFVSVSFWSIWSIDRELIFPKAFDAFFPLWLNHNVHTMPVAGVVIELLLCKHEFPSKKTGFITILTLVFMYLSWVLFIAHKTGFWVYPILQKLTVVGRAAFITGMVILVYIFYMMEEAAHQKIWGQKSLQARKMQ